MSAKPEPRRQGARSAEARRKILAATVELIGTKGLEGFSLAEVGARAGVSRALPGHYFKSREHLVGEAVRGLLVPVGAAECGIEQLLKSLERSLSKVGSVGVRALMITLAAPTDGSPAPADVQAYWRGAEQFVGAHLHAGISAGAIAGDLDVTATARVIVAAIYGEALISMSSSAADGAGIRVQAFLESVRRMLVPSTEGASKSLRQRPVVKTDVARPTQADLFGSAEPT